MDRLERNRIIWLVAMICAIVLGLLGGVGCIIFAMKLRYVMLVVSFLLLGNGFIGFPIYYHFYANARLRIKIVSLIKGERVALSLIKEELLLTDKAINSHVKACVSHKYLPLYVREGEELIMQNN